MSEAMMIYDELHSTIRRWMAEGDELKAFEVVGALEAVKADYLDTLKRYNQKRTRPIADTEDKCENCDALATTRDTEGVPLCEECAKLL